MRFAESDIMHKAKPLSKVHVGVAVRRDARWRGVPRSVVCVDTAKVRSVQRKYRKVRRADK